MNLKYLHKLYALQLCVLVLYAACMYFSLLYMQKKPKVIKFHGSHIHKLYIHQCLLIFLQGFVTKRCKTMKMCMERLDKRVLSSSPNSKLRHSKINKVHNYHKKTVKMTRYPGPQYQSFSNFIMTKKII